MIKKGYYVFLMTVFLFFIGVKWNNVHIAGGTNTQRTMKKTFRILAAIAALPILLSSCQDIFRRTQTGTLLISLQDARPTPTRSGAQDVGDFLLTVKDASGNVFYDGPFSSSPDELSVPAGSYSVSAVSQEFYEPAYDEPQWGDTQIVSVPAGGSVSAILVCSQLNSGLRLRVDDSFSEAFPAGTLYLKAFEGLLEHAYSEKRTAYFLPGKVTVSLDDNGYVQTLFSRSLEERQVLSVLLSANVDTKSGGIEIQVDTAREWLSEHFILGGQGGGGIEDAYDVETARAHAGEKGVWVCGYIAGIATNTAKFAFEPPFSKNTNLILGSRATSTDKEHLLSVELKSGAIRDALNLQDHPELLGEKLYIKGDLVSAYYGIPGLKAPTNYEF